MRKTLSTGKRGIHIPRVSWQQRTLVHKSLQFLRRDAACVGYILQLYMCVLAPKKATRVGTGCQPTNCLCSDVAMASTDSLCAGVKPFSLNVLAKLCLAQRC
jgi:hypothetical protein